jgi:CheY-like chemotaxis protein
MKQQGISIHIMNLETLTPASPHNGSFIRDASRPPAVSRTRRILVADDDALIRQLMSSALSENGFEVNAVSDGEQAWDALCHEHYDLLVTDNEMPRLTGLKLVERIRDAGMSLPVIVASGTFSVERARNDPQLQFAAVIPKPFGLLEMLDAVKNVLASCHQSLIARKYGMIPSKSTVAEKISYCFGLTFCLMFSIAAPIRFFCHSSFQYASTSTLAGSAMRSIVEV